MENQKLLQQPGGLGPVPGLKPLGMPSAFPGMYLNNDISISARRAAYMDDVNRVFAQYNIDQGQYVRPAVEPLPYGLGNITESAQQTGPAGYNHRSVALPERATDMPVEGYLQGMNNSINPQMRTDLQTLTMLPQQKFYNKLTTESLLPPHDYRTIDNLSLQDQVANVGRSNVKK